MPERKPLSKKTRFDVFKRDGFICQYCGSHPPSVILEVDHIEPVSLGGNNSPDNLITSCFNCNRGKGAQPLDVIAPGVAEKSERLREAEEQLKAYYKLAKAREARLDKEAWQVAETMKPRCGVEGFRKDWLSSIKTFLKRMDFYEVVASMEIAVSRKPQRSYVTFQYFCGICWSKIKEANNG